MIGPNDLLYPSPPPNFKTLQLFLPYFPRCPSSSTTNSYFSKRSSSLVSSLNLSPIGRMYYFFLTYAWWDWREVNCVQKKRKCGHFERIYKEKCA